jgi:hypothetical protein
MSELAKAGPALVRTGPDEPADRQAAGFVGWYDEILPGDDLTHFQARVIQDAMSEATAAYWLRRARQFEDARPDPARDHNGGPVDFETGTPARQPDLDDLRARWIELTEIAQACRHRATVSRIGGTA